MHRERPTAIDGDRHAAVRPPLTSASELERLFQRRMFLFNVGFVLALAPLYIGTAIVRADPVNWWVTVLIFGSALANLAWTCRHGHWRRGLFWLQAVAFFSLALGLGAVPHFGVDTPSFWWMSVIPVVTLMNGLTALGVLQGALVIGYALLAFFMSGQGEASLASPALRLYMAVVLSSLYVCANLLFAMFWRGKLQTALQEATDAALASAGAKARFLAQMSHEIRTPLSGVIGAAELLRSRRTDEQQRQQLATLQEQSAKTLLALLNDILDWSKIEAGKVRLEQQPYAIRGLVGEVSELFAATSFDKQIELSHSCNPDVPRTLIGDSTRIRQVLTNLAGNAVKFTTRGSVHLHVSAVQTAHDCTPAQWLRVEVSDSGIGIPAGVLDDVFDAFRQADESVTRRYGGTGLGLSISKELAELMGGRIEVVSKTGDGSGSGSTFTLVLPLQPADARPPEPMPLQRTGLLVCCASSGMTRHMRSLLNELGIEPHMGTGLPGTEELRDCEFLLLDAPLLDALPDAAARAALAARLKARGVQLAVMEGLGTDRLVEAATVLYKPVRRSALEAFLEQADTSTPPAPAPAAASESAASGPQVLLCEDNPVNQVVVQAMLSELGATIVIAGNGREGLEKLKSTRFDLVLMDMQMPELDGLGAARAWRRIEPAGRRLPIVCMTANSRADEGEAALSAGMDDFLAKPLGIADLKECLARWVPQGAHASPSDPDTPPLETNR